MRSPISIRRRAACAVGALSIGATGALALVGAPAASAATTPTSVYPVSLQPSPVAAVASAARPASIAVAAAATPLPASVDLTPWAVPAGDQGQIGSCASWTVGYTISGWYAKKQGQLGHPYAPLFLYTQQTNGQGGGAWGTTFYGNLSTEMNGGVSLIRLRQWRRHHQIWRWYALDLRQHEQYGRNQLRCRRAHAFRHQYLLWSD